MKRQLILIRHTLYYPECTLHNKLAFPYIQKTVYFFNLDKGKQHFSSELHYYLRITYPMTKRYCSENSKSIDQLISTVKLFGFGHSELHTTG